MDWQVEKEHDALCLAVHAKYDGDALKACVELRCMYSELMARVAVARREEEIARKMPVTGE
jgi:hypothetical protein